ncbi:flagellar basal body P-ring biosynthesis protein FlgA [Rosistilla carotiformis]|uniref:Flagellar basal body P-ring biosynthesis protein FlgA n=1 Tax=Rosistilla carotiformis TaxID=2528017 RepID=A0A518JPM0_9BACT|nr:flagellar basal body P-ring formation chaperone FlgA [Rosistilla carotiformis]QDV67490.1 flagellar basal body P-ring biosynthesis protein FlgA [Rosistilla carotiformis]
MIAERHEFRSSATQRRSGVSWQIVCAVGVCLGMLSTAALAQQSDPWTLQLKPNVSVTSSIVRVEDVVQPVSIPDNVWEQLRKSTVGLVPTDGRPLRLMRYRLAEALNHSKLVTAPILWVGPESTSVRSNPIVQVAAKVVTTVAEVAPKEIEPQSKRLIERVVEQAMQDYETDFEYKIEWARLPIDKVEDITSYQRVAVPTTITAGVARFVLTASVEGQTREVPVYLQITQLPRAIVATQNLSRGQIVGASQLQWKVIDSKVRSDQLATDMSQLIGQEVKRNVPAGRWIEQSDVGPPILVRRNDMVEVMVVGGAIVIRTGGKALGEGSEGDLVQIETIEDRKRLLARVISTGLVEIVTRAPQVKR